MRVYFISEKPAALKLDGQYAGTIDLFERYVEIDGARGAMCEIVPHDNFQSLNFYLDENFFYAPHSFADVFTACGEKYIHIDGYDEKGGLSICAQGYACGTLVTIFRLGGIYAACEDGESNICPLNDKYCRPEIKEAECGGMKLVAVEGKKRLALFNGSKLVFEGPADSYRCGYNLEITANIKSCAAITTEKSYTFDGEKFVLNGQRTYERRTPGRGAEHIAFFESVLYGGDSAAYLSDELKDRASALKEYLGEFEAVIPPSSAAEKMYGARSAGLLRKVNGRLFRADYFITEMQDGLITNIYPAED